MNKEEILKKAREEKHDEMEQQVKDKSMLFSYVVMVIMAAVFSYIRSEQGLPIMDLTAVVAFSCSANFVYRFAKIKEKSYLILAVVMVSVGIFATVRFLMGH